MRHRRHALTVPLWAAVLGLAGPALLAHVMVGKFCDHIPLHRQFIPWAMRANVEVVHRADNWVEFSWIRMQ